MLAKGRCSKISSVVNITILLENYLSLQRVSTLKKTLKKLGVTIFLESDSCLQKVSPLKHLQLLMSLFFWKVIHACKG